jgi:TonB family protein
MRRLLLVLVLAAMALVLPQMGNELRAQSAAGAEAAKIDPDLATMAGKLGEELRQAGVNRIVIVDLRVPAQPIGGAGNADGNAVGKWLADQIAAVLRSSTPELKSVERAVDESDSKTHETGTDAVVAGTFVQVAQRIEVSLTAKLKDSSIKPGGPIAPVVQEIAISPEITALNSGSIPEKVYRAAKDGVSSPACIHCPNPEYSDEARRNSVSGSVGLDVTVTPEGTVKDILVTRALGSGLDEKAIEAVKYWTLKPCVKDGQAVPCRVVIEVSFRTFRNRQ